MLLIVDITNRFSERRALRTMFEARKQVFIDLLGWDLPVLADRFELDQFDDGAAVYLIVTDGESRHLASARLLDTTRPALLDGLYPDLVEGDVPRGPDIREITRFCLAPHVGARTRRQARDKLLVGLAEYALANGIASYTGVAELAWFQQIERLGWDCTALGRPRVYDGRVLTALHIRIGRLLIRSDRISDLVMNPEVLSLAEMVLGRFCDRLQLNLAQAIEIHPGALPQFPHRDQDMWAGEIGRVEYLVNVMWPLTPFTRQNGATLIWPASHGAEALAPEAKGDPVAAEANPGDAIVFLGSTLHGAGSNLSTGVRRGIIVSYCLGWLKPYENQWLAYPPEVARRFPPELAALAGYAQHRPNLGNFEGQCPSILFGGYPDEPIAAIDALRPDQAEDLARHVSLQRQAGEGALLS